MDVASFSSHLHGVVSLCNSLYPLTMVFVALSVTISPFYFAQELFDLKIFYAPSFASFSTFSSRTHNDINNSSNNALRARCIGAKVSSFCHQASFIAMAAYYALELIPLHNSCTTGYAVNCQHSIHHLCTIVFCLGIVLDHQHNFYTWAAHFTHAWFCVWHFVFQQHGVGVLFCRWHIVVMVINSSMGVLLFFGMFYSNRSATVKNIEIDLAGASSSSSSLSSSSSIYSPFRLTRHQRNLIIIQSLALGFVVYNNSQISQFQSFCSWNPLYHDRWTPLFREYELFLHLFFLTSIYLAIRVYTFNFPVRSGSSGIKSAFRGWSKTIHDDSVPVYSKLLNQFDPSTHSGIDSHNLKVV
eukprot:GILJ01012080.1.p1 GENE.GILJ01012080.1~~GILJ01012080.1.p1  ORF type:complete len:356 (+),score=44.04 GILJ01012080.1:100-1167(+)